MTRSAQSLKEREVFRAFARVSGLDIDDATIQSRSPPEPDILCETKTGKALAFELTELIDETHMKRIAMVLHTKDALSQYFQNDLGEKNSKHSRKCFLALNQAFVLGEIEVQHSVLIQ